jgi:hypothetical protein
MQNLGVRRLEAPAGPMPAGAGGRMASPAVERPRRQFDFTGTVHLADIRPAAEKAGSESTVVVRRHDFEKG